MTADAATDKSLGPEFDSFVEELLGIDRYIPEGKSHPRAYQIGEGLYQMGHEHIRVMAEAFFRVQRRHKRGAVAARELSSCWSGIGAKTGIVPGKNAWID